MRDCASLVYYVDNMSIKQTAKILVVALGMTQLLALTPTMTTSTVYAAEKKEEKALKCAVLPQSICGAAKKGEVEQSGIWLLLLFAISILTFGVGLVAVAMVAYAAFLYTTAQDNSNQTKQAIEMIRNVVIGIAAYALMWAFLQYLIPGGIFK